MERQEKRILLVGFTIAVLVWMCAKSWAASGVYTYASGAEITWQTIEASGMQSAFNAASNQAVSMSEDYPDNPLLNIVQYGDYSDFTFLDINSGLVDGTYKYYGALTANYTDFQNQTDGDGVLYVYYYAPETDNLSDEDFSMLMALAGLLGGAMFMGAIIYNM